MRIKERMGECCVLLYTLPNQSSIPTLGEDICAWLVSIDQFHRFLKGLEDSWEVPMVLQEPPCGLHFRYSFGCLQLPLYCLVTWPVKGCMVHLWKWDSLKDLFRRRLG